MERDAARNGSNKKSPPPIGRGLELNLAPWLRAHKPLPTDHGLRQTATHRDGGGVVHWVYASVTSP
jgi:hypothetical protein